MSQLLNQLNQAPVKGELDLSPSPGTLAAVVYASEAVALVPGQAVKRIDAAGAVVITTISADTDDVFGVVNYNFKRNAYTAGMPLELSLVNGGNVMWMEASAAIAVGANVMPVVTGQKIATATSNKRIIGQALDKAAADGDLIRVLMLPKGALA